jgi:hypothetical protein
MERNSANLLRTHRPRVSDPRARILVHRARKPDCNQRTLWFSAGAKPDHPLASARCPVFNAIEFALPMGPCRHDVAKAIARAALEPEQ